MTHSLTHPPKAQPGDRVAVLSPAFAAPAVAPALHEQAMRRLTELTGLVPVEYPTTRQLDAPAKDRARDLDAAFADPTIRGILATIGGEDQIQVIPHLDPGLAIADPKPFLGTSDNTNLHQWLWGHGIASFYGGSSAVHLGPGPGVDDIHAQSLRAALMTGDRLRITDPGESEDVGLTWEDPRSLTHFGDRRPTATWDWFGPPREVTGPTWGGCVEVLQWVLTAGRFTEQPSALEGAVLLLETSEDLTPALEVSFIVRSLGERGLLGAVDAVLLARPPVSDFERQPSPDERDRLRAEQRDRVVEMVTHYNPEAVICVGIPFGHTRPQWILPHGGQVTVDGAAREVYADYI
ncbi:conserved hypothetical protein [metagenome]|uniref:LD-carboxypeptidase n=1 Tax=metagenome TaxID=256318 RepID=A0A2P2CCL8_9ZZZZ